MKRIMMSLITALLFLSLTSPENYSNTGQKQQTKTLQASKDNTLIESSTGALSNGKGPTIFIGRTGQPQDSIRRGVLAFDIAGAIPAGSKITSVKLTLNLSMASAATEPATVTLYKATADWGEGTSNSQQGRGAPSTPGDATWIHTFYDTTKWSKAGGDYVATASASQSITNVGNYTWGSTPQMVADVQSWLDAPKGNYGWVILGDETQAATAKVFQSLDGQTESTRPQLAVTFTAPAAKKK